MKFILSAILISTSFLVSASCSIAFENEVSANQEDHSVYSVIIKNTKLLSIKGYRLQSILNTRTPSLDAFISTPEDGRGWTMGTHSEIHPNVRWYKTTFMNSRSAVRSLLGKLPFCR